MSKYIILIILSIIVESYSRDTNLTEHSFWSNLTQDFKSILIAGVHDLEKAIDYPDEITINSFIKFCSNDIDGNYSENIKIENTTIIETTTNEDIVNDIDNEVYGNDIYSEGKNGVGNREENESEQNKKISRIENKLENNTETDTDVSLVEAWNDFRNKLKLFLLHHDIELYIPKNYFLNQKLVRMSFKNMIYHGAMVQFRLVKQNEVTSGADDKIDKIPKQELHFELPGKVNNFFTHIANVFYDTISVLFSLFYPSALLFPFLLVRTLFNFVYYNNFKTTS